MNDTQRWAKEYESRGFALARIKSGQKRPTDKNWTQYSFTPDAFREGDNIGIQAGALSGGLVCIDLDHRDALQQADRHLPTTGMVEGRPGKPKSHRWFRVENVPPEETAPANVAGGIGGPRTRRFKLPDGQTLIDFLGTGSQAVVPASVWTSREGDRAERREWEHFDQPRAIDFMELREAAFQLLASCGWVSKQAARKSNTKAGEVFGDATRLSMPTSYVACQARAYLAKLPPAIEGEGGDMQTYTVACLLVIDFGLSPDEALPILMEYNERCLPPWTEEKLRHKLARADAQDGRKRGRLVRRSSRAVTVHLTPSDGPVFVGVDAASSGGPCVVLAPSLYAGIVKIGDRRELAPELAAITWEGKEVILTPASTVSTNSQEVWGEHFLAKLLHERGAMVKSLHLPSLNGRRRTLSQAKGLGTLVVPPLTPWDASHAAEQAKREASRRDAHRRSLPRQKASRKLAKAVEFVTKHGVTRLTKRVIHKAKKRGLTKDTLRRAIKHLKNTH